MTETVRTIRLYGYLGAKFGRVHRYVCDSPAAAFRALMAMVPGFREDLMASTDRGVRYAVFAGRRNLGGVDDLPYPCGQDEIRIAPVVQGRKGGLFQTLLGVAIIAAVAFSPAGFLSAPLASGLFGLGASLALGGISQMISRSASTGSTRESSYISGANDTNPQGGPVPLLYGRRLVISPVISSGISSVDK